MKVSLAYGRGTLEVDLPECALTVIEPRPQAALPDERAALVAALDRPRGAAPLRAQVAAARRICIVHTDITRPMPNDRIIPWLLAYLEEAGARPEQILLLNALGTHRPNTGPELEAMLTPAVVRRYRCVNHEPENDAAHVAFGVTRAGAPALINRHLVEADLRIVTGFIEPHFFAGFSGGPKGIMPGVAALRTVQGNHGVANIGDPRAAFGVLDGNPIWEEMRDIALRVGPAFLVNVTLDDTRRLTGVFAGDLLEAHRAGTEFVRASAMQPQAAPYDVVVTTNAGYPLDMNLYQAGKGMSAAAGIVRDGGTIIVAAECSDGIPHGSPYDRLLRSVSGIEEIPRKLAEPGFTWPEQWAGQLQARVQRRASVYLYSSLSDEETRAAHLQPCRDIAAQVQAALPAGGRLAVLPQGPLTVPYLAA
jgi:nickel-dependent lactate racemase